MHDHACPAPHFDDAGRLVAPRYRDGYFTLGDGLAETTHVFLNGNRLAERFAALSPGDRFTVGETGFGTGLNLLACWRLFDQAAPPGATLRFVSVEHEPLPTETIRQALGPWPELSYRIELFLKVYTPPPVGGHSVMLGDGRAELVLLVGEAAEALARWQEPADAWFLDGFAPARNPAMWSEAVFAHVARLSHATPGRPTTLATYTAAGFVRRGLAAVGFELAKQPGFGKKRDMTAGEYRA